MKLHCYYCGIKLYFKLPQPDWICFGCEGTGFAFASKGNGPCYKCEGTGKPKVWPTAEVRPDRYTLDHKIPRVRGGSNRRENLVECCWNCNCSKGKKTVEEFRRAWSIKHPLGRLHDELYQWENNTDINESDRAVISELKSRLTLPPPVVFYGETL